MPNPNLCVNRGEDMKLLAYKYRLYPTKEQEILLGKSFGCARWVYNWALAQKTKVYQETGKGISSFALIKEVAKLKGAEETAWLSEVNSQALQSAVQHLDMAFTRFFKKEAEFPTFKGKYDRQSFANPQACDVDFETGRIVLPKFREGIKAVLHRKFEGKIKTVTVSRTKTGKYYASVLVETDGEWPTAPEPTEGRTVGIDLGLKTYATLSDGTKIENPRHLAKRLKHLRRESRRLSRKVKGSKNREKQRIRLASVHEKVAHSRNDFLHQITARLVKNQDCDSFAIEDLSVAGMVKNKRLARHISDAGWGTFRQFLEYKAKRHGKNVLVIGRFEPSSRLCTCGELNHELTLRDRTWKCKECGSEHDRDVLAANNIKRFAFRKQNTGKDLVATDGREFTLVETAPSAVVEARSPRIYSGE